jgi:anaerobic ribonucleoside-triphosphate reductase activating protein
MNYHNITHDDMKNGEGLRVVLWVAGCEHHCKGCQNPITWDIEGGIKFDSDAFMEIADDLKKDYVSGITFSGGDPLHQKNFPQVLSIMNYIHDKYPNKTIWVYTGYTWEEVIERIGLYALVFIDVLVDGEFHEDQKDVNCPWVGSTNQRVIDVKKSIKEGSVIPYVSH